MDSQPQYRWSREIMVGFIYRYRYHNRFGITKTFDFSNLCAFYKAFEKLWYHIFNRYLKPPPGYVKSSLDQHTF